MSAEIVVVGSLNMDLVVAVPQLPRPGETVIGGDLERHRGGKGANQAVAAARLGRPTAMVGCVGDDDAGRALRDGLEADGVDASRVRTVTGVPSGTALIAVAADGENDIVVSPGANARVGDSFIREASDVLQGARVTLLQLEIPIEAVAAAAESSGGTVVLNPAPASRLPRGLLERVDVLVPNRVELAALVDAPVPETIEEVNELTERLPARLRVVTTLGADGAVVRDGDERVHVPAIRVDAVDSTAAGDAFCAALADALVGGAALDEAARWAAAVAAVTVRRPGAQDSLPHRDEVQVDR